MINHLISQGNYQSILCLNGDLPEKAFFLRDLPIIAADGAANQLIQLGILPDLIIGDLDSLTTPDQHTSPILISPDQLTTDFEKCLLHLQQKKMLPAIIAGINGGHIDHILNNINIFLRTNSLFYAPPVAGFVMHRGERLLSLATDTKISLLGFPTATVHTSGLKWELENARLSFPGETSCSNRTDSNTLQIDVREGSLLVLVYLEKTFDAGSNVPSSKTK